MRVHTPTLRSPAILHGLVWAFVVALAIVIVFFLLYIPDFELDASADSLVLENDSSRCRRSRSGGR